MGQEGTCLLAQCPPGPHMFCQGCLQGELRRGFPGWGGEPGKRNWGAPSQVWEHHLCPVSEPAPAPLPRWGIRHLRRGDACTGGGGEEPCPAVCLVSCALGVELVDSLVEG